ncbi:MAG: carboxypeptidase regulatory-like domain-containing protein [Candidatus Eremiobacteraeota bacterium]|nr:carboxypeptidase regulatory-like domain-containing protein [Candidatus Eremiobacteraeota bacterium]
MRLSAWVSFLSAFLVVFIGVTTAPAHAAATGTISGAVVSANGGPIEAAVVTLISSTGSVKTTTAKDGSFSFTGLGAGSYVVRAAAKEDQTASSLPLPLADGPPSRTSLCR